MIVVTSGARYLDIDAYACCVAYAELLRLLGEDAQAVSTAVLNESITPSLRALSVNFSTSYTPHDTDTFALVDISDPSAFDTFVDLKRVSAVFDHRPGFEAQELSPDTHIEPIGAAATLIYEEWQKAGKLGHMSVESAKLLACAILDNTLDFKAHVTTPRDTAAYEFLAEHASLGDEWEAAYFSECQQSIDADVAKALHNDTKFLHFAGRDDELCAGQLVVWNARSFVTDDSTTVADVLHAMQPAWFANVVSISENCSYFLCDDNALQEWLQELLGVSFEGNLAKANRLWLRKEILKAAQERSAV
ncbi:MAG TPA: hypothetical protein VIM53_04880 [Candidatus Saccharimonadales bacterium]